MSKWNPGAAGEQLISEVFDHLEGCADPQIARLRLENQLRLGARPRVNHTQLRPAFRWLAMMVAVFALSGWAVGLHLPGWDDGHQITIRLPQEFTPAAYPHWVAVMAKHSRSLADNGGHSLVVDYKQFENGYVLRLSLLGVDSSTANGWIREVMEAVPSLSDQRYSITQPLVPYSMTVGEMLAYRLGDSETLQRSVAQAWDASTHAPSSNGRLYLIAQPSEYAKRVSMLTE